MKKYIKKLMVDIQIQALKSTLKTPYKLMCNEEGFIVSDGFAGVYIPKKELLINSDNFKISDIKSVFLDLEKCQKLKPTNHYVMREGLGFLRKYKTEEKDVWVKNDYAKKYLDEQLFTEFYYKDYVVYGLHPSGVYSVVCPVRFQKEWGEDNV